MSGILADLETPMSEVINLFFEEPQLTVTITYRLYQGQSSEAEDVFLDFTITAIPSRKIYENSRLARILKLGFSQRSYVIRESDLPANVTVGDLSTNDRILHGNNILRVVEIDKTLGFVIEVQVVGE